MLEPVMKHRALPKAGAAGFTLIELIVAITIAAVLLTIAVPSFRDSFARKRAEGVASELAGDFQLARGEAVARNVAVRLTFGANCYVIHTAPNLDWDDASATSCNGGNVPVAAVGANDAAIKTVVRQAGDTTTFTLQPNATTLHHYHIDQIKGTATPDGGGDNAGVQISSAAASWNLRVRLNGVGRVEICSSTLPGYAAC